MKRFLVSVAAAAVLAATFASSALAEDVRVIVRCKGEANPALVGKHGGRAGWTLRSARAVAATIPASQLAALRADPEVASVEKDGVAEALTPWWWSHTQGKHGGGGGAPPPQPSQTTPWGVTRVGGDPTSTAGAGVDVAIIDTGIDLTHPDLQAHIGTSVSFVHYTSSAKDDNGHGTHCAGIAGAIGNTIGVVGVAPGVTLHAVKVLDSRGSGYYSDIISGIDWCASHGIKVANMSFGGSTGTSSLQTSCDAANTAGVLLIAAAGNSGDGNTSTNEISYPAYYASVVSVGATDVNDNLASFSNSNSDVEVSAPGVSIYSTYKGGTYATLSGTSMASPHTVGVAALYLAAGNDKATTRSLLSSNARTTGVITPGNGYGSGIVLFK